MAVIISRLPVLCLRCKHEWRAETVNEAPMAVVLASWKAMRCPNCGAGWRRVAFVMDARPPDQTEV